MILTANPKPTKPPLQNNPTITIEPMRRTSINEVMAIDAKCYPKPWPKSLYETELRASSKRCYVIARSHTTNTGGHDHNTIDHNTDGHIGVVGHGGVAFEKDAAHITTLAVDPQWRGQKIGIRLLLALAIAARKRSSSLLLEVGIDNPAAQALYRRFGLAPIGIRKNYYTAMGFLAAGLSPDALVMRADSINQPDYANRLCKIALELSKPSYQNNPSPTH